MSDRPHPLVPAATADSPSAETEAVDPRAAALDVLPTQAIAELMNDLDTAVPLAVRAALPAIVAAIDAVVERLAAGGRLLYVGAGTSGRLGVLDASEIPPTYGTGPELVQGVIAGGPDAVTQAREGAEDDEEAGAAVIEELRVGPADAVVGIATSGRTPYVIAALRAARAAGALTVGLSCNRDTAVSATAELAIEVPVGPEIVAGSTRLKAGTATKLVLNMISTIAMVRLGKTYGNYMVDMRATNDKLRRRAEVMVRAIAGVDGAAAAAALDQTGRHVKPAVLVARFGISAHEARARLTAAGDRLRPALDAGAAAMPDGAPAATAPADGGGYRSIDEAEPYGAERCGAEPCGGAA